MPNALDVLIFYPLPTVAAALLTLGGVFTMLNGTRWLRIALAVLILLPGAPVYLVRGIAAFIVHLCDCIRWPDAMRRAALYIEEQLS